MSRIRMKVAAQMLPGSLGCIKSAKRGIFKKKERYLPKGSLLSGHVYSSESSTAYEVDFLSVLPMRKMVMSFSLPDPHRSRSVKCRYLWVVAYKRTRTVRSADRLPAYNPPSKHFPFTILHAHLHCRHRPRPRGTRQHSSNWTAPPRRPAHGAGPTAFPQCRVLVQRSVQRGRIHPVQSVAGGVRQL
jgi:hypothetical protein